MNSDFHKTNALIASFMAEKLSSETDNMFYSALAEKTAPAYHQSWDLLMPVVAKIHPMWKREMGLLATKLMTGCYQGNISIVYDCVVEFIRKYHLELGEPGLQ